MKSRVAVLRTAPETVLDDYARLLRSIDYLDCLDSSRDVLLKINVSWHHWYPACSTTPWQLDGVIRTLLGDGFRSDQLVSTHNRTVVVSDKRGERGNHLRQVDEDLHGIRKVRLYEKPVKWVPFTPSKPFRVLGDIFPDGVRIPDVLIGNNIIHLPTVKTHVFTTITGAMKNAFGGLLSERRHWTHGVIHETLVDLLRIQKEIHPGILAVMDGTFAGEGPGPRAMIPHVKNYILASADQVAIDAVSAKMQGFDPMKLDFIRLAHEEGLGVGDPAEIEIVGEDISDVNFHFTQTDTFASRGQKMIYHGWLKPLESFLLRTPLVPWSYFASRLYHDVFWLNMVGKKRIKEALDTGWGELFKMYGSAETIPWPVEESGGGE
ncbi:MAG: DUF362 domain-containing protein [Candidatus Fermentibacteraceae bacterium]|nr:DUF362 domain-containing protein [Candidatus Fermentibacteraceae bacterium]MBN2609337.1 DUF362 domain-containing protein [Candidatus Fermentibacteraceae bacterium]